jgi:hypothetical protein
MTKGGFSMMKRYATAIIFCLAAAAAQAEIAIEGELAHEYTAQPGQHIEGVITVTNPGKTTSDAKIYQTDYRFKADGSNYFDAPGSQDHSNANWVVFSPKNLTVPGGQKAIVSYSIDVPADPALSGSYWSILMVEEAAPPVADPKKGLSIGQTVRYGVQLIVTIGNTGTTKLSFKNPALSKEKDGDSFAIDIANDGQRVVRPTVTIELYDSKGKNAAKLSALQYRLYPGCSFKYRFTLPADLEKQTYKALIVGDCGDNKVFGANVNLALKP